MTNLGRTQINTQIDSSVYRVAPATKKAKCATIKRFTPFVLIENIFIKVVLNEKSVMYTVSYCWNFVIQIRSIKSGKYTHGALQWKQ